MNIFVAKLNFATTSDELRSTFEQFGEVSSAKVVMDRETGRSKGFGFVEMPNDDEASDAIEQLDNSNLDGNTIVVKKARPKEESGGSGNRGGSYNRGGGGYNRGGGGYNRSNDEGGYNRNSGGGGYNRGGGGYNRGNDEGGYNRNSGSREKDSYKPRNNDRYDKYDKYNDDKY